jgi:hypothetical protein
MVRFRTTAASTGRQWTSDLADGRERTTTQRGTTVSTPLNVATFTLAQQLGNLNQALDIPSPPPLPEPPVLERYLFEQPWMPLGVLVLVGLVSLFWMQHRGQAKRGGVIAGICLVLAGGLALLATLVETSRERARLATDVLVAAVAQGDGETLRRELTPDARVFHAKAPAVGVSRDDIADFVSRNFSSTGMYRVSDRKIEQFQAAELADGRVQVQVKVRVTSPAANLPVRAWLKMDFVSDETKTLRCSGIEAIHIQWLN